MPFGSGWNACRSKRARLPTVVARARMSGPAPFGSPPPSPCIIAGSLELTRIRYDRPLAVGFVYGVAAVVAAKKSAVRAMIEPERRSNARGMMCLVTGAAAQEAVLV